MKWKVREPKRFLLGDTRIVRCFLFLPTKPEKEKEYRWLEMATILQKQGFLNWCNWEWIDS